MRDPVRSGTSKLEAVVRKALSLNKGPEASDSLIGVLPSTGDKT